MLRTASGVTCVALALVLLAACGGSKEIQSDVPPKTYEVRGMVRQISPADAEERQIWIHHEAIPDFVDIRGETSPMDAMTMPFHLAASVDLSGIEPGDKVSFRLDVDWSASVPARIGSLRVIAPETPLSFEEGGAAEPAEHGDQG